MPFSSSTIALGDALKNVIKGLGIQRKLEEVRTVETWAILAGPQINGVTHSAWVKGDRLYIKVTSAAWRQELHLRRREWRDQLNEQLGKELVREIVFR
jgi:predicted nucleic acid-binding Zn ribbon protein